MPTKRYGSRYQSHQIILRSDVVRYTPDGTKYTEKPLLTAQFKHGIFETDDEEIQQLIEKGPDFRNKEIVDLGKIKPGSAVEAPSSVRLPANILKRMTVEELLDYAAAIRVELPMSPEQIREGNMKKAEIIAALQ
jgi:hypothetical protein